MGTYEKHRDDLKSGDVILLREHTLMSKVIRTATRSDYCHCGVVWRAGPRIFLLESRFSQGVTMRLLSEALPVDWIATGCKWTEDVETAALLELQTRYSVWAAIALGLGISPPKNTRACSLFATRVLSMALPGFVMQEKGDTPGNLGETLMALGLSKLTLN